ncbi:CpsD/CapB family tyrosine-protein kinase [Brotaphodocola sp.]|uniref:CpsD/CapB family tyrosine-protein kinase n=1 Tax=Brotaphodocola sp. TaxID=3073577 RepID=UPI003D7D2927
MSGQIIELANQLASESSYAYREAVKTLRTNIQFCGSNVRKIMFTSALPDEGKSQIAVVTSQSLAQIGKRVLLVDADIRRSVLASRYSVKKEAGGLSQYLSGQKKLEEVISHTDVENFDIVLVGPYSPNPAELLEEDLFGQLIDYAAEQYDYVIIDTPPMGAVIDGAIVATKCDGAVMVIESGSISYHLEQKVKDQLDKSGCRILGVVLNRVRPDEDPHGKYYGKYGKYGRYGKYDSKYGETRDGQSDDGKEGR